MVVTEIWRRQLEAKGVSVIGSTLIGSTISSRTNGLFYPERLGEYLPQDGGKSAYVHVVVGHDSENHCVVLPLQTFLSEYDKA